MARCLPLTASDILELQAHCQAHYIELVPNLNSFGHFERWLRHPEYHAYAECPDGFIHPLSGKAMPHGSTLRPTAASLNLVSASMTSISPCLIARPSTLVVMNPGNWDWATVGAGATRGQNQGVPRLPESPPNARQKKGRRTQFWGDIVLEDLHLSRNCRLTRRP